jgi:hypothetical protein
MSIPQNKPLPIKRESQYTNDTNYIKNPGMGFIPSSWNYGSFHQTNPRYTKIEKEKEKEKPIKLLIKENPQDKNLLPSKNNNNNNMNKFGKRILNNEEKIVTEDLLKAMNDNKNIRGTSRKLSQTRSSSNLKYKKNPKEREREKERDNSNFTQENYNETNTNENQQNRSQYERNSSYSNNNNKYNNTNKRNYYNSNINNNNNNNQNLLNRSRASSAKTRDSNNEKKTYKFGMTYEEWNENKSRHVKIAKTLNLIKEERMKEIEIYDNQINQKYIEAK